MPEELSPRQAQRLVVASQGFYQSSKFGKGASAVARMLEHLSYVQIDTISVVERAHHHVLWSRLPNYQTKHLDAAVAQRTVFEYWSHAAAFLPMRDFRFTLPKKHRHASGETHWYKKDTKQCQYVLDAITERGPMMAKDFDQLRSIKSGWGDQKPAKRALEVLFMEGKLMVTERRGFQKVFDLSHRVVPDHTNQSMPSEEEFLRHLVVRFLSAQGLGTPREIAYLRKGKGADIQKTCLEMLESSELVRVKVGERIYFTLADFESKLSSRIARNQIKILSPFDNLLIQRRRAKEIFRFDYTLECYLPAAKRQYGYFVLPVMSGMQILGRVDLKFDRRKKALQTLGIWSEVVTDDFEHQISKALSDFEAWMIANTAD